ncbi:MAG: hypothetical protein L0Z53_21945, partial [Acidobacteriales bacterium]|nr:hypothetical protein [Terriglobales bacterium]
MSPQLFSPKVRRFLLPFSLTTLCWNSERPGFGSQDGTAQPVIVQVNSPDQIEYRYEQSEGECRNAAGQKGTNPRLLAPCGDLA